MFSVKRNQVVITALVVMIAVAGYLSYIDRVPDTAPSEGEVSLNSSGEVGALIYDSASGQEIPVVSLNQTNIVPESGLPDDGEINIALSSDSEFADDKDGSASEPGEAVFVNSTNDSSFFVQEKLDREQGRSRQREMLMEMINSSSVDDDKKSECADKLLEIQDRIERETSTEAMIEAKGFGESYVRIDDETIDVIVTKKVLSDAEVAQIEDIVKRKTGMAVDKIRISSLVE